MSAIQNHLDLQDDQITEILNLLKTMSQEVDEFYTKQSEFNDRQAKAIDGIVKDFDDAYALIKELKDTVANSGISAEDKQKFLQLNQRMEAGTTKLEALDAANPPTPPTEPPSEPPTTPSSGFGSKSTKR